MFLLRPPWTSDDRRSNGTISENSTRSQPTVPSRSQDAQTVVRDSLASRRVCRCESDDLSSPAVADNHQVPATDNPCSTLDERSSLHAQPAASAPAESEPANLHAHRAQCDCPEHPHCVPSPPHRGRRWPTGRMSDGLKLGQEIDSKKDIFEFHFRKKCAMPDDVGRR